MQKRDSMSAPRDAEKCEQEDWAAVSGSERIAAYRPDKSLVEAYTTGFSQTSIFIPTPFSGRTNGAQWHQGESKFLPCFCSLNTTSSHRMFSMAYRRAKSTQGNTNFQKRIFFWQTTSGSLPAGLNLIHFFHEKKDGADGNSVVCFGEGEIFRQRKVWTHFQRNNFSATTMTI